MLRKEPWGPPTFNREMKGKVTDEGRPAEGRNWSTQGQIQL